MGTTFGDTDVTITDACGSEADTWDVVEPQMTVLLTTEEILGQPSDGITVQTQPVFAVVE